MTQEDKQLLLKDLCARLPYGVKYCRESWNYEWDQEMSVVEVLEDIDKEGYIDYHKVYKVDDIKPYLRPMSSMTKDEKKELLYKLLGKHSEKFKITKTGRVIEKENKKSWDFRNQSNFELVTFIDFCPKNVSIYESFMSSRHLDFRGLIPMGLALEAPEGMYKEVAL